MQGPNHRRAARVNTLLREEISAIVRRELRDPRVAGVTITGVEVTRDLRHARVYVSSLGNEQERESAVAGLNRAAPLVRGLLGRRVRLRNVPELEFRYDASIEHGLHIDELLRRIESEEGD
jgi:ribosome-binding factor A